MSKLPHNLIAKLLEQYEYDEQGNRLKAIVYGKTFNASYNDDDELIAYGSNTYQYDQDGFLKSKTEIDQATGQSKTTSYQYGTLGELRSVTLPDNTIINYFVKPDRCRVPTGCEH
jgi:hypothetical protein